MTKTLTFTLLWNINDDMSFQIRANDRLSDRIINNTVLLTEGYGPNRGTRNTTDAVYGLRKATHNPGAVAFTTLTGQVGYGVYSDRVLMLPASFGDLILPINIMDRMF